MSSIVERFAAAYSAQDVAALVALFTEDGGYRDTYYGEHTGTAALTGMFERMFREGRDYRWVMDPIVETPERAAAEWMFSYTVTDALPQLAGRKARFAGMSMFDLEDGRIRHYREMFDLGQAMIQLGHTPERIMKVLRRRSDAA